MRLFVCVTASMLALLWNTGRSADAHIQTSTDMHSRTHMHTPAHTHKRTCIFTYTIYAQDNGRNLICFVNIADDSYNPKKHMGVTYEDAMETIHAIYPSGEVRNGVSDWKNGSSSSLERRGWTQWLDRARLRVCQSKIGSGHVFVHCV